MPIVSVIIPTYNDTDSLLLCLNALEKQTCSQDLFEVIVVNNNCNNELQIQSKLKSLTIIVEPKPGSYAARNLGLQYSSGSIVAFTDADCVPYEDWILNAIDMFDANIHLERLTGPVDIFKETDSSWLAWKFESITAFNQKFNVKCGVAVTANLFVRSKVFKQVGDFNSSLFSGGDIEWNQHATRLGFSLVYSEQIRVMHPARLSMNAIVSKSRRVLGGDFMRAQQEKRLLHYTLRHLVPPVRYAKVLIDDGKPLLDVIFAVFVYWALKILMIFEVLRLSLGAKPVR